MKMTLTAALWAAGAFGAGLAQAQQKQLTLCWAAQAALHHFHGVPKHELPGKAFGVFPLPDYGGIEEFREIWIQRLQLGFRCLAGGQLRLLRCFCHRPNMTAHEEREKGSRSRGISAAAPCSS